MSELSDRARELVRSGRAVHVPTDADRARVTAALTERLGDAAMSGAAAGTSGLLAAKRWLWPGVSVLALGVGGALFLLRASEPAPAPVSEAVPAALPAPAPAPAPERAVAPSAAVTAAPSPPVESAPAASRRDRLAEEVAMLSKATGLLNSSRAADALLALEEHQRKFPTGVLTEERRGARAQALCALGRRAEAEKELARLARTSPQSPHLVQARKWCARPDK